MEYATTKLKKEKSVRTTEFVIVRAFAERAPLREIMLDLICAAYAKDTAKKTAV